MNRGTTPVYLVRHAAAGDRETWTGADHLRPLTELGRRQAEGLVVLFGAVPFVRFISSPYVRCVQTLEPLAEARTLPIETDDRFAEGAPVTNALALIRSSAVEGATVVCTHGDVMMLAVEELLEQGVPRRSGGPIGFEKGCTWVLEVADGAVTSASYLPPPGEEP